jgi:predicted Zn-dependent protease
MIRIFDGTIDPKWGTALIPAFAEIAKSRKVELSMRPGTIDIPGYELVKTAETVSICSSRGQVDLHQLLGNVNSRSSFVLEGKHNVILTDEDIYAKSINWCYGCVVPDRSDGRHMILSTKRLQNLDLFTYVATHELGHMFNAAPAERSNTVENLGSHCTNHCIMEQKLAEKTMLAQYMSLMSKQDKFCYQCRDDLRDKISQT